MSARRTRVRLPGIIGRLLALAVLGAAAPRPASAQQPAVVVGRITGIVVDAPSGRPVTAARVRVLAVGREEITHGDGAFTFDAIPAGPQTVTIARLGYRLQTRQVEVRAGDSTTLRVVLVPAALDLAPVVVTGTLTERSADETLTPTTVVGGAELDRRVQSTVAATLQSQPGIAVTSIGPATGRPVIRGLSGDRLLVLEDGLRPGDLSSTSGDHAVAIDPLTARQIEVVRGPNSLLYGSSALGGVVNVVREEVPASLSEHPHGVLSAEGGSVNSGGTVGGYAATRLGRVALRAEGSARSGQDVRTPAGRLVNTDAQTVSASAGAAFVGARGHVGGAYRFYDNDYGIPGGFVGGHERGVDIRMRRHMLRGEAERRVGAGPFSSVRATAQFTDYNHVELEQSGSVGTSFAQDLGAADVLARHDALGPFATGAVGARVQYRDVVTGGSLRTPSTYDYSAAGYVVEELGRGPLRVQVGGRYDWARYVPRDLTATVSAGGERVPVRERTFGSASGSLGALYTAAAGVRVGASVSRAYRTPDFNELYSDGPHLAANSYDVGDPNLDEETGLGLDAFVRLTRDRVRAEVALFRNQLDSYITPSSRGRAEFGRQGGRPRFQYTNEDAVLSGVEGDVEVSVTPSVIVEGTLSYVRARFTSERAPLPLFTFSDAGIDTAFVAASPYPALIPPLNGQVAVRFDRPRYFAGAGLRLVDRQSRLGDFEDPTSGYGVGNLSAGHRFLAGSRLHTLTLRIDNVFDREYRDHLSRVKAIMPEPGRNVSLLYRLAF